MGALGRVQDGGMKYNCPVPLAEWENSQMKSIKPDVMVSFGTGYRTSSTSKRGAFLGWLFDKSIIRLLSYLNDSFDSEKVFQDFVESVPKENRSNYFRMNVPLPEKTLAIDEVERVVEHADTITDSAVCTKQCERVLYALVVASLYFELCEAPIFLAGSRLLCSGTIRARIQGKILVKLLTKLSPCALKFVTKTEELGSYQASDDLCPECYCYQLPVSFIVRDTSEPILISLESRLRGTRKLSAFPQTIKWFVDRQGLDADFGVPYHRDSSYRSCRGCQMKRASATSSHNPNKKIRLR